MRSELEELIVRKGFNYTQLSQIVGVSRTAIKKYERGTMPAADVASRLAEVLGITVSELIVIIERSKSKTAALGLTGGKTN